MLLVVVPVSLLTFTAVAAVPARSTSHAPVPIEATETECLEHEPIESVDDLNDLVDSLRSDDQFMGADVGASVTLSDGRRLWVFGDTLRSATYNGQRFVRNSMLVFDEDCASVVLPASHGALIPDRSDGVGYWPMSIAMVPREGYDLVGVSANRVRSDGVPGDAFAFTNLGPAMAVFVVAGGRSPQLLTVMDIGKDSPDTSRPAWGAASVVTDDWVYLYGTAHPGTDLVFGFSLHVARMHPDDLLDVTTWRYWDGSAWVKDPKRSVALIPADQGVSQTLSVFEQDGRWYAVSKRDEYLGSELVIWSSPGPTGPFVAGPPVASIPSDVAKGRLRYMPLAHPDLLPEAGTVVVSYSRNNSDVTKIEANPFLYRPRFLRVDLP